MFSADRNVVLSDFGARAFGDDRGFRNFLNLTPLMSAVAAVALRVAVGQPELVWLPFGLARISVGRDLYDAQRGQLTECRSDATAIHPVFLEIIIRDRQVAVFDPAVASVFDFDAGERSMRR
jgi:hypothetical protein